MTHHSSRGYWTPEPVNIGDYHFAISWGLMDGKKAMERTKQLLTRLPFQIEPYTPISDESPGKYNDLLYLDIGLRGVDGPRFGQANPAGAPPISPLSLVLSPTGTKKIQIAFTNLQNVIPPIESDPDGIKMNLLGNYLRVRYDNSTAPTPWINATINSSLEKPY